MYRSVFLAAAAAVALLTTGASFAVAQSNGAPACVGSQDTNCVPGTPSNNNSSGNNGSNNTNSNGTNG